MENFLIQKNINANNLFDDRFLDTRNLYLFCFNSLPSVNHIHQLDGEKAFAAFKVVYGSQIKHVHQYRWYRPGRKSFVFDKTVVILDNNCLVEFDDDYCEILHNGDQAFVAVLTDFVTRFKERKRKQPLEINLIVQNGRGLDLKSMEVKRTRLELDLFYEDGLALTDEIIRKRLCKNNDKGIVLLHGIPGTGKTTYLRYLIGKIKKRVLFMSPAVAGNLMNPEFIDLLIDNPNTVLIIEDAEHIIGDRKYQQSSSVSNLLNISDGLLSDFLNVQLICTFNSPITLIDGALLRKGRLIARHEFGKLSIRKAQRLSDHLGYHQAVERPMTIAEITNPGENDPAAVQLQVMGFRREPVEN
jgi:hypothetical protein